MWSDFYTLIEVTQDQLHTLQEEFQIPAGDIVQVLERSAFDSRQVFRVPARYRDVLMREGVTIMFSPPYNLVDPDIHRRRASNDFAVWMSGYKDEVLIEKCLRFLARTHPDVTKLYEIGRSHEGRPILALKISDRPNIDEDEPAFLFNGAHHGNELLAPDYVLDLAYYILNGRGTQGETRWLDFLYEKTNAAGTTHFRRADTEALIDNFEMWFVPLVNPDGLHVAWNRNYWAGRKNTRDTTAPNGVWNSTDGIDLPPRSTGAGRPGSPRTGWARRADPAGRRSERAPTPAHARSPPGAPDTPHRPG